MATPKVFVSSTCFDLKEVRDSLSSFIKSYGFEPILSEHGDVFYHPDLHTHEACVHEVANCQLFILIIGGRFGGSYVHNKEQSITNAEYAAAKESNIPVFTYVKKGVYDNHHTYHANKTKEFINDMEFPNIEKQENALDIFNFIDQVRKSKVNNAFETFETSIDIDTHLRKQWAGMFFEYLRNREVKEQVNAANVMLSTLKTSSEKLEEMLKGLYNPADQEERLDRIEHKYEAIKFFEKVLNPKFKKESFYLGNKKDLNKLSKIDPKNFSWDEYLIQLGTFERGMFDDDATLSFHVNDSESWGILLTYNEFPEEIENDLKEYLNFYKNGIQKLNEKERKEILIRFLK